MCFDDRRLAIDRQPGKFRTWFIACIDFVATKWRTLIARVNLLVQIPFDTVSPGGDQTPLSPPPVRVLTVPGAAGAKANSCKNP
jgi:hypothetical protein